MTLLCNIHSKTTPPVGGKKPFWNVKTWYTRNNYSRYFESFDGMAKSSHFLVKVQTKPVCPAAAGRMWTVNYEIRLEDRAGFGVGLGTLIR